MASAARVGSPVRTAASAAGAVCGGAASQLAIASAPSTITFTRLVTCWTASLEWMPIPWTMVNTITTTQEMATAYGASAGTSSPAYSPTAMLTSAMLPQLETQSLQPTTKPG